MRRCNYPIVILTYLSCFGFNINPTVAASYAQTISRSEIAQANSSNTTLSPNLGIGSAGEDVKLLQTQLKKLGYYDGLADGIFGSSTRNAVTKFQREKGLLPDGIAGTRTTQLIKTETLKESTSIATPTPETVTEKSLNPDKSSTSSWIRLGFIAMAILAGVGISFYIIQWLRNSKQLKNADAYLDEDTELVLPPADNLENPDKQKYLEGTDLVQASLEKSESADQAGEYISNNGLNRLPARITQSPRLLPAQTTSSLAKINVVDELIQDLENSNPTKRSKAIWELGQKGDSRAIQPLVEQMVDADSQQRSLILAALSEIGSRTLKPMNRALAISMQDESAEVRKNAIRDLTRVYDIMAQMSQMLSIATEDDDPEVQQTAKYAISQMNRIRALPSQQTETQIQQLEEWENREN